MAAAPRPDVPVLTFLGGARSVTGSRYLVETPSARVLVDCGLFQGEKELRLRNREPFPLDPRELDAVVVTHAHVDHCGWLPVLTRDGFEGPVLATPDTGALAAIVLPDSGHLQEEEAEYANRKGYTRHRPAVPLYTERDGEEAAARFVPLPFGEPREIAAGVRAALRPTGHILGAASVRLELDLGGATRSVVFSGDLGRAEHPLLVSPSPVGEADVVVMESTYGDRQHAEADARDVLADVVTRTAKRGGTVVVPAFAVDRTEVLLFNLRDLRRQGRIPELLPVFVDSPMALAALEVYRDALRNGSGDVQPELRGTALGDLLDPGRLGEVRSVDDSKAIDALSGPSIVISASGMATGGRVLHHLACRLPDPRNAVVLVGFQAAQTRGRLLAEGARQLKLLGRYVPVRAEVVELPAFSAHADRDELVDWLATAERPPEHVFLVHGEERAAAALAGAIEGRLGWDAIVPQPGERVRLD